MSFLSRILGGVGKTVSSVDDELLEKAIGGLVKSQPTAEAYNSARQKALDFLASNSSNDVISESKNLLKPGEKIYRANTTPLGISWTTSRENALKETSSPNDIIEYTLQKNDRYISPEFVDKYSDSAYPQQEVLFNGRGLVDESGNIVPENLRGAVASLPKDSFTQNGNLKGDVLSKLLERSQNA